MSMEALTWARKQRVGNSRAKAVFMALADFANEDFSAFPSVASIEEYTELDRKTVIKQVRFLIDAGFLVDTGKRQGETRQIPVYRLQSQSAQTVAIGPSSACTSADGSNGTGSGIVEGDQIRNRSKSGTVPTFPGKSPKFSGKESQVSVQTVPSSGHGTPMEPTREPSGNPQRAPAGADASAALGVAALVADGVDKQVAKDWLTLRKAKRLPLTRTAWDGVKDEAERAGITPGEAVKASVLAGWAGFRAKWLESQGGAAGGNGTQRLDNGVENEKAKALLFGAAEVIDV
ncbi:hypothetical protein BKK79_00865 [Cupriavidus sp. USMAA2-4]|uniref:helix-turn-helix domain-containing protein n=1 Tax=Cupriavidus sp. USMAA2-4 TaxID=876364 RepID=UPI0008A6A745|nr:helix-turn-helix domain-containing protein [Cupriavidus sp. USMAA2-4]AOY90537.1 hypothetical protein BKK79_00865 [Cupriavidus sp. USMAA2-4]